MKSHAEIRRKIFELVHKLPADESDLISAMTMVMSHEYHKRTHGNELWNKILKPIPEEATESLSPSWRCSVEKCPVCQWTPDWYMYEWKSDPSVPHHLEKQSEPKNPRWFGLGCGAICVSHETFDYKILCDKWKEAVAKLETNTSPGVLDYLGMLSFYSGHFTTRSYRSNDHELNDKLLDCIRLFVQGVAVSEAGGECVEAMQGAGSFAMAKDTIYFSWGKYPNTRGATLKIEINRAEDAISAKCHVIGLRSEFLDHEVREYLSSILSVSAMSRIGKIEWMVDQREFMLKDFMVYSKKTELPEKEFTV